MTPAERIAQLESAMAEMAAKMDAVMSDNERLASLVSSLESDIAAVAAERDAAVAERDKVISQILLANARAYGSKSEKVLPHQLGLFNDMEAAFEPSAPEPEAEEVARPRKKRKRRECVDWSKYDTVVVEHRLEGDAASCPACGSQMEDMGYQVKRVFKIRPAHVYVEEHRQYKGVCRECSRANEADGGETPVQVARADMPEVTPVEGSCASASLVAYILDRKYCLGLPVYRIAADLRASSGLTVTRQAMAGWVVKSWQRWLSLVFSRMRARAMESAILHIDETRIQVLKEPGRKPTDMSWAWLFCTPASFGVPIYLFKYDPSRGNGVPHAFLPEGWRGTIVTDGHSAYSALMDRRPGDITRVSCLVHIRRKFMDVLNGKEAGGTASEAAVAKINEMFHVDNGFDGMAPEERAAARMRELKPLMDSFSEWLEGLAPTVMEGTLLDKAVTYARNQFPYLRNALSDGRLPIENNRAEQAIRPLALGRRAWLFSDTQAGAEASCGIYSVVTTARANGLMPMRYLEWLLEKMPNTPDVEDALILEGFMPWSPGVPESCRMTPAEAAKPDPMAEPLVDVDPNALDEG